MPNIVRHCQNDTGEEVSAHEKEVCGKHVFYRPVDLYDLSVFPMSVCSPGGEGALVGLPPSMVCRAKGGDGLSLGWESFAKQNVENSLQHLLLFFNQQNRKL